MYESALASSSTENAQVRRSVRFLETLFPPPRRFAIRLWEGTTLPAAGLAVFTLVLRSPGTLRRMFHPPIDLSMGEAYLRRDFDVEGDLISACELLPAARATFETPRAAAELLLRWLALPLGALPPHGEMETREPARLTGKRHSRGRNRSAIRYHYDVGNEFYQLLLDRRMVYSCAYFPTGREDLDAAQEAKLDLICRKLALRPGEHLLDIGCGWGGLLIFAAERYGVSGLGVTLSEAQHRLAVERVREAGLEARVRIEQKDYRDVHGEEFDKIVSVGMFEHVGRAELAGYFAHAYRLLRPGGLFLNHGIANRPPLPDHPTAGRVGRALESLIVGNLSFLKRYIFPDGELVTVSEANLKAEWAGFEVRDVDNLREHYALTLRHWLARLRQHREAAISLAGEPVFRLWELYLAGCIHGFETAGITVNQTLLAKTMDGQYPVPFSRAELYSRPRDA